MRITDAGQLFMIYKEAGETIESISDQFGVSVVQLCYINCDLSDVVILGEDLEVARNKLDAKSGHIFIPMSGKAKELFEEYNMSVQRGKFKVIFNELNAPDNLTVRVEGFDHEIQRQLRISSLNSNPKYTNVKTLNL